MGKFGQVVRVAASAVAAMIALVALPGTAQAVVGLNGAYYKFSSGPNSAAQAQSMMTAAGTATATFLATSICYPSCGGISSDSSTTLTSFLGSGATNLSASAANVTTLNNHAIDLTGYISFDSTGDQLFALGSDDGSMLYIDGNLVVNNDGLHGFATQSATVNLSAGLHSIRIIQFENGGDTGLTARLNGSALSTSGSGYSLSTSVPEPATWGLMIVGFGLAGAMIRRRGHAGVLSA